MKFETWKPVDGMSTRCGGPCHFSDPIRYRGSNSFADLLVARACRGPVAGFFHLHYPLLRYVPDGCRDLTHVTTVLYGLKGPQMG
jgi:hypothetical protein